MLSSIKCFLFTQVRFRGRSRGAGGVRHYAYPDPSFWGRGAGAGAGRGDGGGRDRGGGGGRGGGSDGRRDSTGPALADPAAFPPLPRAHRHQSAGPRPRPHPYAPPRGRSGGRGGGGVGDGGVGGGGSGGVGGGGGGVGSSGGGGGRVGSSGGGGGSPLTPIAARWGALAGQRHILVLGDSHARRVSGSLPTDVDVTYVHAGVGSGALGEDVTRLIDAVARWRLSSPACPAPDVVAVSFGGNALTTKTAPHAVGGDHAPSAVAAAVADSLRRLLVYLAVVGAPGATLIVISVVPRLHLSGPDLLTFRELTDVQRAVVREFAPRCVLLDVERLLAAKRTGPDSWHRQLSFRNDPNAAGVAVVEAATVDVWSVDPLPRDFPRLGETDFVADGVHLHHVHYRTIRAAAEEEATVAALQRRHRPLPPIMYALAGGMSRRVPPQVEAENGRRVAPSDARSGEETAADGRRSPVGFP